MGWGGAFRFEIEAKSMETETKTWWQFPKRGKVTVEHILGLEEINASNRAGKWESQSGNNVGKLSIWISSFEIIIIFEIFKKL